MEFRSFQLRPWSLIQSSKLLIKAQSFQSKLKALTKYESFQWNSRDFKGISLFWIKASIFPSEKALKLDWKKLFQCDNSINEIQIYNSSDLNFRSSVEAFSDFNRMNSKKMIRRHVTIA